MHVISSSFHVVTSHDFLHCSYHMTSFNPYHHLNHDVCIIPLYMYSDAHDIQPHVLGCHRGHSKCNIPKLLQTIVQQTSRSTNTHTHTHTHTFNINVAGRSNRLPQYQQQLQRLLQPSTEEDPETVEGKSK